MITEKNDICNRCARCCVGRHHGKEFSNCKFLGEDKLCTIYENRLGRDLGNGFRCIERKYCGNDYPDCPYNFGFPMHPFYTEEK